MGAVSEPGVRGCGGLAPQRCIARAARSRQRRPCPGRGGGRTKQGLGPTFNAHKASRGWLWLVLLASLAPLGALGEVAHAPPAAVHLAEVAREGLPPHLAGSVAKRKLTTVTIRSSCPASWTESSSSCYRKFDTALSAPAAAAECAKLDPYAHLASPETAAALLLLPSALSLTTGKRYWLGIEGNGTRAFTQRSARPGFKQVSRCTLSSLPAFSQTCTTNKASLWIAATTLELHGLAIERTCAGATTFDGIPVPGGSTT